MTGLKLLRGHGHIYQHGGCLPTGPTDLLAPVASASSAFQNMGEESSLQGQNQNRDQGHVNIHVYIIMQTSANDVS